MAEATTPITDPPAAPPAPPLTPGEKLVQAAPPQPLVPVDPPEPSPRAQKLAELGFENVKDDDEAFDRLISYTKNLKNEFGTQLQQAIAEVKQSSSQPTAPVQDAKTGKWTWAPPAIDSTLIAQYRAADGNWKDGTPESVKQSVAARQAYQDSFVTKFIADPGVTLKPLLEDTFEEFFERKYGQLTQAQQQQTFQQKLYTENQWLFEADPVSGKPLTSNLSAEGKLIDQYMQEAQQRGADYELAWEFAVNRHRANKAEFAAKQTTTNQTAEQINAQKKAEMLRAGNAAPSRGGSLPLPAAPVQTQNRHLSFGERFRQNAERNGVPLNPVA
jgi:hypothetical protein